MTNIKLYRNCEIREEKNFAVDDIERYLRDLVPVKEFDNVQYIKQGLDITVNVKLDQTYLDREWTNMYNYCRIENGGGDDNCCYYFIRDKQWISKDAIKLVLHMDVINTYKDQVKLTDKTTINRQHKDRFVSKGSTEESSGYWYLDDEAIFSWGDTASGFEGVGELPFESLKGYTNVTFDIEFDMVTQPTYTYEWDAGEGILTLYVLAPTPGVIPQERVDIEAIGSPKITVDSKLVRNIDFQPEGLNAVLFKKEESAPILNQFRYDNTATEDNSKYYLVYRAQNAFNESHTDQFIYDNPIDCFLTSDKVFDAEAGNSVEVDVSTLPAGTASTLYKMYFITLPSGADGKHLKNSFEENYPSDTISFNNKPRISFDPIKVSKHRMSAPGIPPADKVTELKGEIGMYRVSSSNQKRMKSSVIMIIKNDTDTYIHYGVMKRDNVIDTLAANDGFTGWDKLLDTKITFKGVSKVTVYTTTEIENYIGQSIIYVYDKEVRNGSSTSYSFSDQGATGVFTVETINKWNLLDSRLLKIIELPYQPTGMQILAEDANDDKIIVYNTGADWIKVAHTGSVNSDLKLNLYENSYFTSELTFDLGDFNPANNLTVAIPTGVVLTTLNRDNKYESKLYHSDFDQYKLVYDSFSYAFQLENYNAVDTAIWNSNDNRYNFAKMVKSVTPSSSFMLDLHMNDFSKVSMQDYNNVFIVNRNNEYPIFNNQYYNYLRNGYNYDVKNKQVSKATTGLGIGLSAASLAFGIAANFIPGLGTGIGATAIAGGVAGLAGSITSGIASAANADRAMEEKLEQLKNQGTSVQGSDDLGLLDYYTDGNKMKMVHYGLSDNTQEIIADLFYYCGYKCDYQDVPDTDSRYWFNFVQCTPVYDEDHLTAKMSKACLDELSTKYAEGITFLHGHYNAEDNETEYDFKQVKENWETWLIA